MTKCASPRGTIYSIERGIAVEAGCGRWRCESCGRYKARRVAAKFAKLNPDYLVTLTVPPGRGWPTLENYRHLQNSWRWFSRWMQRHKLVAAYGWVTEVSEERPGCTCPKPESARGPQDHLFGRDCFCGTGGNRLHRHLLVRLATSANRFGRRWLPYADMQAAAARCGLGTIDCRPIFASQGAARYVSKYLAKSIAGEPRPWVKRYAMNVRIDLPKEGGWLFSTGRLAFVAREYLGGAEVDWDAPYWSQAPFQ